MSSDPAPQEPEPRKASAGSQEHPGDNEARSPGASDGPEITENHSHPSPTASHALAQQSLERHQRIDPDPTSTPPDHPPGASQVAHTSTEVKDLGWNDDQKPSPIVGGLGDPELWTLIRRFDKQVFCVKSIDETPLANLDMNVADDEDFSPEKLRAQLERLYMSVIVSLFAAWKHVARLRSWKEDRRTSAFLAVYLVAWLLDLVLPTLVAFVMVLILSPHSRDVCFPPAPLALVDASTGGVQKPAAGVLASTDSVTGAPERYKGEAVEQEAHSFVNSIATLVVSTAVGKHDQADPGDDNSVPDPTHVTQEVAEARDKSKGSKSSVHHNHAKEPVTAAVWNKARPIMHQIGQFVDGWERFGNALSPTPPFPTLTPRLTLAACLVPMLFGTYYVSPYMASKGLGFGVGFGFFGDPIIQRGIELANRTYPRWEKYVELRHTILRGVPTNAQLTVTLLRIGERNSAPVPPPPSSDEPPPFEAAEIPQEHVDQLGRPNSFVSARGAFSRSNVPDMSQGVSQEEVREAAQATLAHKQPPEGPADGHHGKGHRVMKLLKGTTKGGVETALTADKAKALARRPDALNRRGVLKTDEPLPATGPISFPARYKGRKGHVYITSMATTPALSWTPNIEELTPAWTTTIGDISELKKVGGLGWKTKIIVGWSMGREVVDGLAVKTKDDREAHFTAVIRRDELFNRLIAMGSQMWETR